MLVSRRHDLVVRPQLEPEENDIAPFRGRRGERDPFRLRADESPEPFAHLRSQSEDTLDVLPAGATLVQNPPLLCVHRLHRRPGERAGAAGVQVRDPLEDRKLRACLLERHSIVTSTGA